MKKKTTIARIDRDFYDLGMRLAKKNDKTFIDMTKEFGNILKDMDGKKRRRKEVIIDEIEF